MKIAQIALICGLAYFSYHAVAGNQGLSQWARLQDEQSNLEEELSTLKSRRDKMQQQVERLGDGNDIDLDLLEEIVRQEFHFVRPGEVVIGNPLPETEVAGNLDLFDIGTGDQRVVEQ